MRILVVEDERDVADLYTTLLATKYDVQTAYNGQQALELVDETIDIVLLDRRMPGLSGDEVLQEIDSRNYECQVVLVTAVEPDFDIIELGFDAYVKKAAVRRGALHCCRAGTQACDLRQAAS